jgi:glutathione S-transferase
MPERRCWNQSEPAMKLFTHPGASSLSVHILLREIGAPFALEVVDVSLKHRPDGSDYRAVAPAGWCRCSCLKTIHG